MYHAFEEFLHAVNTAKAVNTACQHRQETDTLFFHYTERFVNSGSEYGFYSSGGGRCILPRSKLQFIFKNLQEISDFQ